MKEQLNTQTELTPAQQLMNALWDEHVYDEFAAKDAAAAIDTMVPDAYVNHVPVLTGGVGREQLQEFYSKHFIPNMPPDTEIQPISRTIGSERLVDEMIIRFTHSIEIDWMLPGIPPTGKRVECATVAIVQFRDGKLFNEHIYWDQASVLVQLGLIHPSTLPVAGVETAKKVADPSLPSNQLIQRARNALAQEPVI
jgi:carboxymethylenebutenolidase